LLLVGEEARDVELGVGTPDTDPDLDPDPDLVRDAAASGDIDDKPPDELFLELPSEFWRDLFVDREESITGSMSRRAWKGRCHMKSHPAFMASFLVCSLPSDKVQPMNTSSPYTDRNIVISAAKLSPPPRPIFSSMNTTSRSLVPDLMVLIAFSPDCAILVFQSHRF
jgi:hypothetical protein